MPRTKLGITAGLLAAACYFVTFFGGIVPAIVLAGYVLLFEQDLFLRRAAVKAVAFTFTISLLVTLIGFIPDAVGWISSCASLADNAMDLYKFDQFFSLINKTIYIIKDVFFVLLGINAFKGKDIKVPFVDPLLAKYM